MSQIYTKDFEIDCPPQERSWHKISRRISELPLPGVPIRLILTAAQGDTLTFECSFIDTDKPPVWPSLLDINIRQTASKKLLA